MNERYSRLFSLEKNLYAEGSPVIIEAGALLKDNQKDCVLVQLKILNISKQTVNAVKVHIAGFDSFGKNVCSADFQYVDLHASRGSEFGVQTPIVLENNTVRSFDVTVTETAFLSKEIWHGNQEKLTAVNTVTLSDFLQDQLALEQYRINNGNDCNYVFSEYFDLWLCVCGKFNHKDEKSCFCCGRNKEALAEIPDKYALHQEGDQRIKNRVKNQKYNNAVELFNSGEGNFDSRLQNIARAKKDFIELADFRDSAEFVDRCDNKTAEIEAEQKQQEAEQKQREEQKRLAKIRKRKKAVIFVTFTAVLAVFVFLLTVTVIIPELRYNAAIQALQNEDFSSALDEFKDLGDYKASSDYYQYTECVIKCNDKETNKIALEAAIKYLDSVNIEGSQKYKDIALEAFFEKVTEDYNNGEYEDLGKNIDLLKSYGYDAEKCSSLENEYINKWKELSGSYINSITNKKFYDVKIDYNLNKIFIESPFHTYSFDLNDENDYDCGYRRFKFYKQGERMKMAQIFNDNKDIFYKE